MQKTDYNFNGRLLFKDISTFGGHLKLSLDKLRKFCCFIDFPNLAMKTTVIVVVKILMTEDPIFKMLVL